MASFNRNKTKISAAKSVPATVRKIANAVPDTKNLAGSEAFRLTPHYELAFLLLTSFLEAEFYRTPNQTVKTAKDLITKVNDPTFVAKAAVYARTEYGMRSISHLVAAEIAKRVKGETWTKSFFDKIVYRVDDASEILAAYITQYDKPIPNSLKKGLALSLSKFNAYQLAKYKGNNKGIKLVDLFNLVHPKPSAENAVAYKELMEGRLASMDTWESELSEAGQGVKSDAEKATNKAAVWKDLVTTGKIGYFALLRNLRNIVEQADSDTVAAACTMLQKEKLIEKSLVLPFRFMTAQNELQKLAAGAHQASARKVLRAIEGAVDIALKNVPRFAGDTLVVLDTSGSMITFDSASTVKYGPGYTIGREAILDPKCPAAIGSLFAAVIAKANDADVMQFSDNASYMNYNGVDGLSSITNGIRSQFKSGGTDFRTIFRAANRKYDRIIILSDMQGWVGGHAPLAEFRTYCANYKANPKVYSFDLKGYGSLQFPQSGVFALAGFSEKTLDLMKVLEHDPSALIKQINDIEL